MHLTDYLLSASKPAITFELIPPLRGGNFPQLEAVISELAAFHPPFIDVTSHAAQVDYRETADGFQRRIRRKRPGTLGICAIIQHKYGIEAVPHILCQGFTREETEDFLIELQYLGLQNVFAIQGDDSGYEKPLPAGRSKNTYALDLVQQITAMNQGHYLDKSLPTASPTDFCIGVAGYPEKHFQSPNKETDVDRLQEKIAAGASYVVTQMFFDNQHYFSFVDRCRAAGLAVPIIPGIKILTRKEQLRTLPEKFHVEIPYALSESVRQAPPERGKEIGIAWAVGQVEELLAQNVPGVHFYVMGNAEPVKQVLQRVGADDGNH